MGFQHSFLKFLSVNLINNTAISFEADVGYFSGING